MLNEKELEELLGKNGYSIIDENRIIKDELKEEILEAFDEWLKEEEYRENWLEANMRDKNN